MDISIIIVNWNTCDLLRRCLASIKAHGADLALEIIVVDNASADDSVAMVRREFPQVRLIVSPENLGYTGGNNLGAQEVGGRYLLILNPDTEIVGDALPQMAAYLDAHPGVGVVGPQLLYPDGSIQPSRRRFPRKDTGFLLGTYLGNWFLDNRFERAHTVADVPDDRIQPVEWLVGAALLIRRETWQAVGPFDRQFFMYSDEVDWCYRCHRAGWEIHYLPQAQIIHYEKGASRLVQDKTRVRFHRSRILYYKKYFGWGWATALRLFLLFDYAWQLFQDGIKWLLGRQTEARYQRMRICRRALQSGLNKDIW